MYDIQLIGYTEDQTDHERHYYQGNRSPKSDYQIAVYGIEKDKKYLFDYEIRELPTLLNISVLHMTDKTGDPLKAQIEREGVLIYSAK